MTAADALEKVLPLFQAYYVVERENAAPPFGAEASFTARDEHYAFFQNVKLSEADSKEYLFFAAVEELTLEEARRLDEAAWNEGLSRVRPGPNHRNTDIGLVLFADRVTAEAAAYIKKLRRHKSYRHMFHGWSNYRAIAIETSSGVLTCNRLGQNLRDLFSNINFLE